MSVPVRPASPGGKAPRQQPPRRQHQPYRRTSAVIDERPDGKPVIFGYGRHMTRREKDAVQRLMAYTAMATVIAASVVVIAVAAYYQNVVYPNQTVATVNGQGINRHDRDLMANFYTASAAIQGQQLQTSASTLATAQLQKDLLVRQQAQQQFGLTASTAEADTALTKAVGNNGTAQANLARLLQTANLSRTDYDNLIERATVLRTKVAVHLTAGNPTAADQWNYARIEVTSPVTATTILRDVVKGGKGNDFTSLARTKSTDTATNTQGGTLGWERLSDAAVNDPQFSTLFLPALKAMQTSHTSYRVLKGTTSNQWWVLHLLGHDPKHPLSATQIQADQTLAYNNWYAPLQARAAMNPALPPDALSGGTTSSQTQTGASAPITLQPGK